MHNPTQPRALLSPEGGAIILQGLAYPALYFPPEVIARLHEHQEIPTPVFVRPYYAVAIISTMMEAGADFTAHSDGRPPSAEPEDICFTFTLRSGVKIAYLPRAEILQQDVDWLNEHNYTFIVVPDNVALAPVAQNKFGDFILRSSRVLDARRQQKKMSKGDLMLPLTELLRLVGIGFESKPTRSQP